MRLLRLLCLSLPLLTSGCFVGDGVAHIVKLANKSINSSNDNATPQQAQTPPPMAVEASNAPIDRNPAPMPAADMRDQVRVEELPPKG
jgi:hypothetical protein